MFTEFISVQLTREELQEIQRALIQRDLVSERLVEARTGIAPSSRSKLLEQIEDVLGETDERLERYDQECADALWEFSWYAFTEEWAWFRAKQDLEAEQGQTNKRVDPASFEKLVELRYQKNFEIYVGEIGMLDELQKKPSKKLPRTAS